MRRSQFGLLTVVAAVGLLLAPGCQFIQPIGSLTVVSINGGNTLRSDLSDFSFNPVDSVYIYQVGPDSVTVEMTYAEIGAGLPTWTPPVAIVTQASVKFTSKILSGGEAPNYSELVRIGLREAIPSDPSGKKITTFRISPVSASWKYRVFGTDGLGVINEDEPYADPDIYDLADAKITFTGYDSVANRQLSASGTFEVEFGNFYDDPNRFGK